MGIPVFDYYLRVNSIIHQLNPKVKIIWVLLVTLLSMIFNNPLIQFLLILSVALVAVIGKLKIKKIIQICRPVFYLGISVAILWAFYEKSGIPIITISSISITDIGVLYGLSVGMRITTMLIVIIILLMSTDQGELMAGFVGLKIPYPFVLVLILSLRFFPMLLGEFRTLQEAQSSRGLEWEKGGLVKRVKNFMPLFVPIVVRGLQIVQNLSYSVESRGFGAVENRTFYRDLKITKREKTILLVLIFVSCLLITLRLLFGFGVSFSGKF